MSINSEKALGILQSEYNRLVAEGIDSENARDFLGKDAFGLEAFSSWSPSSIRQAKNELLSLGFIEENVLGECKLAV